MYPRGTVANRSHSIFQLSCRGMSCFLPVVTVMVAKCL